MKSASYRQLVLIFGLTLIGSSFAYDAFIYIKGSDNRELEVYPLNNCIISNSDSLIYKEYNSTFAERRTYRGSTTCDELHFDSQLLIEGEFSDLNKLMNDNLLYLTHTYSSDCTNIFKYSFFKEKGCYKLTESVFMYYQVTKNSVIHYSFEIEKPEEYCVLYNNTGKVSIFEDQVCYPYGTQFISAHVNQAKVEDPCADNGVDPMGIMLVFFFLVLVLF